MVAIVKATGSVDEATQRVDGTKHLGVHHGALPVGRPDLLGGFMDVRRTTGNTSFDP